MRIVASLVVLSLFGSSAAADEWLTSPQAKLRVSRTTLPAITYAPSLSLDENNARIRNRDPLEFLELTIRTTDRRLDLHHIVGRQVHFTHAGRVYHGTISAAFVPGQAMARFNGPTEPGSVRLLASIRNEKMGEEWRLKDGSIGTFRVGLTK